MVRLIVWLSVAALVVGTFVYFHGKTEYRHPHHQAGGGPGHPMGGR